MCIQHRASIYGSLQAADHADWALISGRRVCSMLQGRSHTFVQESIHSRQRGQHQQRLPALEAGCESETGADDLCVQDCSSVHMHTCCSIVKTRS